MGASEVTVSVFQDAQRVSVLKQYFYKVNKRQTPPWSYILEKLVTGFWLILKFRLISQVMSVSQLLT
jgi:hypothetical protein